MRGAVRRSARHQRLCARARTPALDARAGSAWRRRRTRHLRIRACTARAGFVVEGRHVVSDPRPRRVAALVDGLTAAHLDGLLITGLSNIRYLTGFSGSSALLLVA